LTFPHWPSTLPKPNKPDAENPAIASRFRGGSPQRAVADPGRSAHAGVGFDFQISATPEPDEALIAPTADILRTRDALASDIRMKKILPDLGTLCLAVGMTLASGLRCTR